MGATKIEWCDMVWNPITGCEKVSEGCENCWAERMHKRFSKEPFHLVQFHSKRLEEPLKVKKPKKIFVCSMGDLFHPLVSPRHIDQILQVIEVCEQHTFLILTKRPQNIENKLYEASKKTPARFLGGGDYLPNIWLGVSVENQRTVVERVPTLINIPASLHFISVEPMLGGVNLEPYLNNIDWVICGGESGRDARPLHPDWVRDLRDQCVKANVPFFLKQWGEWSADGGYDDYCYKTMVIHKNDKKNILDDVEMFRLGKKLAGNLLDGKIWNEFPKIEEA